MSIKTGSTHQVPEYGALKGFSDSLATLDYHWETSLEEVTRRIPKWFAGLSSGSQERTLRIIEYQSCDQSSRRPKKDLQGVLLGQTGIVKFLFILQEISIKMKKRITHNIEKSFSLEQSLETSSTVFLLGGLVTIALRFFLGFSRGLDSREVRRDVD